MRFNKKSTVVCAIAVGAAVLATSAFADVMLGSGYHSLKAAAKTTAEKLTEQTDSFTINVSASLKVDGSALIEAKETVKYDMANRAHESVGTETENGKTKENYYYRDKKQNISRDSETGVYHVWNIAQNNSGDSSILNNPFKEEQAEDAEKIIDAFVGNLQDIVQIEESDGKKLYTGNLTDAQVPPLVNAISSYVLKYSIFNEMHGSNLNMPYPKTNIHVVEATGRAVENEDGIIISIIGSGSIAGTDKDGTEHIYTAEFSVDVKDINSTVVQKPDLSGQKTEYSDEIRGSYFDEKYVGVYKNDIIGTDGNTFIKKGERVFEITSVSDSSISGKYYEVYKEGFAPEEVASFEFTSDISSKYGNCEFNYIKNGEEKTGIIYTSSLSDLNLELDVKINANGKGWSSSNREGNFNNNFRRVFE